MSLETFATTFILWEAQQKIWSCMFVCLCGFFVFYFFPNATITFLLKKKNHYMLFLFEDILPSNMCQNLVCTLWLSRQLSKTCLLLCSFPWCFLFLSIMWHILLGLLIPYLDEVVPGFGAWCLAGDIVKSLHSQSVWCLFPVRVWSHPWSQGGCQALHSLCTVSLRNTH